MANNKDLARAQREKKDEFYTQLGDIEDELRHYRDQFWDKVVFCNCDDPDFSNFFVYFQSNFWFLELKALISTHYEPNGRSYKLVIERQDEDPSSTALPDVQKIPLKGDGDFRSPECLKILDECDIVVTNPPFSLFNEFIPSVLNHGKKILVLGPQNAITYKDVFKYIQKDQLWLGYDNGGTKWFRVPDDYDIATESRKKVIEGVKYFSMGSVFWYTNLDTAKRHESMTLYEKYSPEKHPHYDNYDAIEAVPKATIPVDYPGVMGVPITFMTTYNPDQFEILGATESEAVGASHGLWHKGTPKQAMINGKKVYKRLFVKLKDVK